EDSLTLIRDGNGWKIEERDGYPAKLAPVREVVLQLAQAKLVDAKTDRPAKHALLELENPADKKAKSKRVQLLDKSRKPIADADIVVGKKRWDAFGSGKSGMYVRKTDKDQTWLASLDLNSDLDIKNWVEENFFTYSPGDIESIEISYSGEDTLHLTPNKDKPGEFIFSNLPESKTIKKDANASPIGQAFKSLSLEDVKKLTSLDMKDVTAKTTLDGKGLTIVFNLYKLGADDWISVQAKAEGDSSDDGMKIAANLNKKLAPWAFKIPKSAADTIFKRWSDLVDTGS
ncbi:MAG: DUF4340 domain-containing protein, partial [Desulfobulbia bacterium]